MVLYFLVKVILNVEVILSSFIIDDIYVDLVLFNFEFKNIF